MDLKGKNIIVTGGAGIGIGSGICRVLSARGARVIVNDLDADLVAKSVLLYPNAVGLVGDISQEKEVQRMYDELAEKVGVVHGLVNNAGVGLSKQAHEVNKAEFDHLYDIDIKGAWLMSKAFVNQILLSKVPGGIVNVSSVHAEATISKYAVYASAKSAVEGLTRGMAVELGTKGIRVNAIAPGYVHADQNLALIGTWTDDPQGWVKEQREDQQVINEDVSADDCGEVVAFLLSDSARAVTGQTISVDAGSTKLLYNRSFTERN